MPTSRRSASCCLRVPEELGHLAGHASRSVAHVVSDVSVLCPRAGAKRGNELQAGRLLLLGGEELLKPVRRSFPAHFGCSRVFEAAGPTCCLRCAIQTLG